MSIFPDTFLWGASTSSHQIEGGLRNQWTEWEHAHATELAATAQQRLGWLPNWPEVAAQAQDPNNYISGAGVDHYHRYSEDFDLLTKLNMNSLRFGIEWARLQPKSANDWDEAAIEHYKTYIAELKKRGMSPVVTLWHWTMPVWFAERGGFARAANIRYFEAFVQKVCDIIGTDVRYVITLNEPNVYTGFSYGAGEWPPQTKNPVTALRVYKNLVTAHKRAYRIIKAAAPDTQVGIAAQLADSHPLKPHSLVNKVSVGLALYGWNWWFLNRITQTQDFIGVNYYFTEYRDWLGRVKNPTHPVSDLGWYMEPSGIGTLLQAINRRYHKPLLIVENGLADHADSQRGWWIAQTMSALEIALQSGVPVIGYLHWSLLDNFEWKYGWWPRFGLVSVDRTTMKRTIRPSAHSLAAYIASHSHHPAKDADN
jgi:beta-glucosidase